MGSRAAIGERPGRRSLTWAGALAAVVAVGLAMAASGPPAGTTVAAPGRPRCACRTTGHLAARRTADHRATGHRATGDRTTHRWMVAEWRNKVGGARLAGRGIVEASRAPALPGVPASAYVVANAATGAVLAAKDAHGEFPPASTLKVLTAITMLRRLRPDATIVASRLAASAVPNIVGLVPGRRYRVADLFRALLMISANDAAVSLVQGTGSFTKGMALVNAEARRLRAYDVIAKLPNGLPAPGQVVSAYDLALIARQALAMPAFLRYDETLTSTFYGSRFGQVPLVNQNALLTQYPGAIGGKIGWTLRAGATYIGMARRNGVTLIVTILHATPLTEIASAERLLDWGFAANGRVRPVGVLVRPLR